jgi:pimeloyl-ACP methyl ester carboxylesterase
MSSNAKGIFVIPYANNQGVRIHYQVEGEGPALVLQHGFSGSFEDWYEFGYVERLQKEHRLILVDARGHGASDKPHEPKNCTLEHLACDIATVLDDVGVRKAHFLGYSMGGWIGFGMAKYASPRLNSLIIGGAQPYGMDFQDARSIFRNGIEAWIARVEDWGAYSSDFLARVRGCDPQALLAIIQDRPDMSDILPSITIPSLLYAGGTDDQYDRIEQCANQLPGGTLVKLSGLGHHEVVPRSDLVVPHVIKFLQSL